MVKRRKGYDDYGVNRDNSFNTSPRMNLTRKQKAENEDRAQRARNIMSAYAREVSAEHPDDAPLRDLLADLMHRCASDGSDFDFELAAARGHFEAEQKGE